MGMMGLARVAVGLGLVGLAWGQECSRGSDCPSGVCCMTDGGLVCCRPGAANLVYHEGFALPGSRHPFPCTRVSLTGERGCRMSWTGLWVGLALSILISILLSVLCCFCCNGCLGHRAWRHRGSLYGDPRYGSPLPPSG